MSQLFSNNAATTLSTAVSSSAVTLVLSAGTGAKFPAPTGGNFFLATLVGRDANGVEASWEIVRVTTRASDTLTVIRGQEGTAAVAWPFASQIQARATAGTMSDLVTLKADLVSPTFSGIPTVPTAIEGTNTTQIASTAHVRAAISALVNSSPAALDTLNELAMALGGDANFATTVSNNIATKAPLVSPILSNPSANTFTVTGYDGYRMTANGYGSFWRQDGNNLYLMLTNNNDANGNYNNFRPFEVRLATGGVSFGHTVGIAGALNLFGGITGVTPAMVGLGDVTNTADTNKPVSTAQASAIALKANAASPELTGVPTAPTAALSTNSAQIATMAAVQAAGLHFPNTAGTGVSVSSTLPASQANQWFEVQVANLVVTLPALSAVPAGATYTIRSSSYGCTIKASGSESIQGASSGSNTYSMVPESIVTLVSNGQGGNWYVVAFSRGFNNPTFTGTVSGVSASMVGLGNVTNTADTNKPVSAAQASAIALKANAASPTFTGVVSAPSIITWGDGYRLKSADASTGYGQFWRNDGSNYWLMLTANNDAGGVYNTLRPMQVTMATGDVSFGDGALIVNHGGPVRVASPALSDFSDRVATTNFVKGLNFAATNVGNNFTGGPQCGDSSVQTGYGSAAFQSRSLSGDTYLGLHAVGASAAAIRHTRGGDGISVVNGDNNLAAVTASVFYGNFVSSGMDSYRLKVNGDASSYGTFWRNDGNNLYLMLTALNNANGSYNALRPFSIGLVDGKVSLGHNVAIGGTLTVTNSISSVGATLTTNGSSESLKIIDAGNNGAGIKLAGNGATTPNKSIRATNGNLEIVNSAYSAVIASITDSGAVTATSFSGFGTGLTGTAASLSIGGSAATANYATNAGYATSAGTASLLTTFAPSGLTEVGRYFDFHSVNNANDYDARIDCQNPTGGDATSVLAFECSAIISNGVGRVNRVNTAASSGYHGSISITGAGGGFAGIHFPEQTLTLMMNLGQMGFYTVDGKWLWSTDSAGNSTSMGNVTAYSDERKKTNWRPLQKDFVEQWACVKHGVYDRTDIELTQVGLSAQAVQRILPDAVVENTDGFLSLNYGAAAGVATVQLAKRVVQQDKLIQSLIERLTALEAK